MEDLHDTAPDVDDGGDDHRDDAGSEDERDEQDAQDALTPEDIAYRSFASARRGISEPEVREFLHEVAEEMAAAVGRERELLARIHQLEERIAHPPPPTEDQILEHLGEETARVLRSAQEAADEIRANASARAQAITEQAEGEATQIRRDADNALADRSREAEVAAKVILNEAEGRAQADLRQAARDGEAGIEAARQRGREMVGEARAVRERILADLGRRRSALQAELEQLETARTELMEAGRVAKATLGGIVDALAAFDEAADEGETGETGETVEAEADAAVAEVEVADVEVADVEVAEVEAEAAGAAGPEAPAPEANVAVEEARPPVEELFARIRADREDPAAGGEPADRADVPEGAEEGEHDDAQEEQGDAEEGEEEDHGGAEGGGAALLARRDETLAPVHQELVRRCKRALQDEQNELLDRLRRQRGAVAAEQLLAPLSVEVTDWADVLEPAVDEAYGAGHSAHTGATTTTPAPRRLVSGLAEVLVTPLRERLIATIDAVPGDDGTERASRVGARYREWRSQELEFRVGDVLAAAYTRGVYDAAPDGARLQWISAATRCPDCDDNALEPTPRGAAFPTGQPFPPAHPGCRCLITVSD